MEENDPTRPQTLRGSTARSRSCAASSTRLPKSKSTALTFDEQLTLLDSVGKNAPALARLLKSRRDLINQELDPAAMLRQALLELQEEWPELKKFGEQFK